MSKNTEAREGAGAIRGNTSSAEVFVDAPLFAEKKNSSTQSVNKQLANTSIGETPERRNSCTNIEGTEQQKKRRREDLMDPLKDVDMESEDADTTVIHKSSSEDLPDKYKVTR